MIRQIKQILLDKSILAAENTTSILSLISFISGVTIFVSMHPWGMELSMTLMIFLSLASICTISFDIWFKFRHIFPKGVKTPKVRNIKYLIFGIAMLTSLAQSGAITLLIVDDLEKTNSGSLPSYTNEYRIVALIVYDCVVPILYIYFSNKIIKQIESNNKLEECTITKNLGWR